MTIIDYVEVYATTRDIQQVTRREYECAARQFSAWFGQPVPLSACSKQLVNEFICAISPTVAAVTAKGKLSALRALLRAAEEDKLCNLSEGRWRRVKVPPPNPDAFSQAQLEALLAACSELPTLKAQRCMRTITLAVYDSGLRVGDMLALRREQIQPVVRIVQRKTNRLHTVYFRERTMEAMRKSLRGERVVPMCRNHVNRVWRVLRELAGIPLDRRNGLQKVRRSYATLIGHKHGPAVAAERLGHAPGSLDCAVRHYIAPLDTPVFPPELNDCA